MASRADGKMEGRAGRAGVRRLAVTAAFAGLALALSYLEFLLPLGLIVPLPGVKLGLANLAVLLALVYVSPGAAAAVSLVRVTLAALLFGTPTSFALSLGGAAAAYAAMILFYAARKRLHVSFLGLSAACAAAHSVGQIGTACVLFGTAAIVRYLPVLLLVSALTGTLTGLLLNLSVPLCDRAARAYGFGRK